MKKIITKIGIASIPFLPFVSYAQEPTENLRDLMELAISYLNYAVYLIMALAVVMFVWNIYKYFIAGGDNKELKKEAGMYVMWSVIGFFVILSFWGLVNILTGSLRLSNRAPDTFFGSYNSSGYNQPNSSFNSGSATNLGSRGSTNSGSGSATNIGSNNGERVGLLRSGWNIIKAAGSAFVDFIY
jgi:uncharacterized membrane protein